MQHRTHRFNNSAVLPSHNSTTFTHTLSRKRKNPAFTWVFTIFYLFIDHVSVGRIALIMMVVMQALANREHAQRNNNPISVDAPAEPRRRTEAETLLKTAGRQR